MAASKFVARSAVSTLEDQSQTPVMNSSLISTNLISPSHIPFSAPSLSPSLLCARSAEEMN